MKRLWIALALLAALLCGTLLHTWSLRGFTQGLSDALDEAQTLARADRWEDARSLTEEALQTWRERDVYLHVLLRHADTDQIYAGFQEAMEYLDCREGGEYSAANARLLLRLELLSEAERLTLKNVL